MTLSGVATAEAQSQQTTSSSSSASSKQLERLKDIDLSSSSSEVKLIRRDSNELKKTVRFAIDDEDASTENNEDDSTPGKEKKKVLKESVVYQKRRPRDEQAMPSMAVPTTLDKLVPAQRTWLSPEERHKFVRKSLALNQSSPSLFTHLSTSSPAHATATSTSTTPKDDRRRTLRPVESMASGLRKSSDSVDRKTWIKGQLGELEIKDDIVTQTKVLYPDTMEMRFLKKYLGSVLIKGPVANFLGFIFVAPLTNLTCFSLYYQLYLNEIFHVNILTRLGHFIFMPITYLYFFVVAAQFNLFGTDYHHDDTFFALKPYSLPFLMALCFTLWHTIWGLLSNTYLLGLIMLPVTLGAYLSGNYYVAYFGTNTDDPETRFLSTVWYATPFFWLATSGFLQMSSHAFERLLPPRINLTARWLTWPEFIRINCPNVRKLIMWWIPASICGTLDEIVASPRLLPLYVLHLFFLMGYHSDEYAKIKELAKASMAYNNPALDFIGTGGALQPSAGDYVYLEEEKKKEEEEAKKMKEEKETEAQTIAPLYEASERVPLPLKAIVPATATATATTTATASPTAKTTATTIPATTTPAVASITAAPAFRNIKRRSRSGSFMG